MHRLWSQKDLGSNLEQITWLLYVSVSSFIKMGTITVETFLSDTIWAVSWSIKRTCQVSMGIIKRLPWILDILFPPQHIHAHSFTNLLTQAQAFLLNTGLLPGVSCHFLAKTKPIMSSPQISGSISFKWSNNFSICQASEVQNPPMFLLSSLPCSIFSSYCVHTKIDSIFF